MKTITIYTPRELKEHCPENYQKAYEKYRDSHDDYLPFHIEEVMESLKEVFKHSGIILKDWSIYAWSYSCIDFNLDEDIGNLSGARAFAWLENNLLSDLRIPWTGEKRKNLRKYGRYYRPGRIKPCPFTGVCYDEDFLESLYNNIKSGMCIQDSYLDLANTARKLFEAEFEDVMSEEYFLECDYPHYTETGRIV